MNKLYFGDNLDVLRNFVASESVDLVYLDPPFNSQAQYNVLFATPDEQKGSAQAGAFRDTWSWGEEAEYAYSQMMRIGGPSAKMLDALRSALGESDLMAYLAMMTIRLLEMRRIMKSTASLYLHCDPTASHYLKLILDAVFGAKHFGAEIIWKRSSAHNDAKQGRRDYGRIHDTILYIRKSQNYTWNVMYSEYDTEYENSSYKYIEPGSNRRYGSFDLTGPGGAAKGNPFYEFLGVSRYWRFSKERMAELLAEGRIIQTKPGAVPRQKRFLDEMKGVSLQDLWTDINPIPAQARERLGYPTQKPLALLDRIIGASSNEGDVILDPFCGCGTSITAAEGLGRKWIGIDVAIHAVKVIEARLEKLASKVDFHIEGIPRDFASAEKLAERDKYQFQWWANYLFNPHALREQKKGADRGVDGELYFPNGPGRPWGKMLTSVKGGDNVGVAMIRDFAHVLDRDHADMGLFICLRRPTSAMSKEAVRLGYAKTAHGLIPKMQIVAIEDWFGGIGPTLPPLEHLPSAVFNRPTRVRKTARPSFFEPELPFSFAGGKSDENIVRHFNPAMISGAA